MTTSRIKHRTSPTVIAAEALLPSQRALLEVPVTQDAVRVSSLRLPAQAINHLGEVLAYDVALMMDETCIESGHPLTDIESAQSHLALMADRLLRYDPLKDPYEGFERGQVRISESTAVNVRVQDGFVVYGADGTPDHNGRVRFFTPEGYVDDPIGDFRQKLITFEMNSQSIFVEDAYFNFSAYAQLRLYTNNLIAQPPRWEFTRGKRSASDMLPSKRSDPYFFRLRPDLITDEVLAQSVVGSLVRVIRL